MVNKAMMATASLAGRLSIDLTSSGQRLNPSRKRARGRQSPSPIAIHSSTTKRCAITPKKNKHEFSDIETLIRHTLEREICRLGVTPALLRIAIHHMNAAEIVNTAGTLFVGHI